MRLAERIANLPPYLFAEIDKKIAEKKAQGVKVISLGIGDPVEPTPPHIIEKLYQEALRPENHRYPAYYGLPRFREAIARWYRHRFKVTLDPEREVLPLIGSKEGLAHICLALLDPEDLSLVADPAYPVYATGTILAGGNRHYLPLLEENHFNPDLEKIPAETASQAKLLFLNYPNNPTAAIAKPELFEEVVAFAKEYKVIVCHDNPYSEITFDGYAAPSFLETPGAKEVGVEFNSLSKTYNMTGWRCGFVVGNPQVIEALGRVKTNIDSGIFNAIQYAGIAALEGPQDIVVKMRQIYARRRDLVIETLKEVGIDIPPPQATIYVWVPVLKGYDSTSFATHLLEKAGVVIPPGKAYGPSGEGYVRISLTVKDEILKEALTRIKKVL